jgi:hypothetical protein
MKLKKRIFLPIQRVSKYSAKGRKREGRGDYYWDYYSAESHFVEK